MRKIVLHFIKKNKSTLFAALLSSLFFILYSILSLVRHNHFGSYGFDLGVIDQVIWKYSQFKAPITTIHHYPFTLLFTDHIEFIYIFLAPLYWIWNDARMILLIQAFLISFSAFPLFLLCQKKKLKPYIGYAIQISYLLFYGVQNAVWFDVHSATIGVSFLPWFLYFIDKEKLRESIIFFLLAIISKEDIALFTFLICFIYFIKRRKKTDLILMGISAFYIFSVFAIYYPYFTKDGYRHADQNGMLANMHASYLFDTSEKRKVIMYGLASFGFLPLITPLFLLPAFGDLFHFFVVGHNLTAAQGFFMHYRVTLALCLAWPTIISIAKYKKRLNTPFIAGYLIFSTLLFQYILHLPLSYLVKKWFWKQPSSIYSLQKGITYLPKDASVVSQNNITPHISHRDSIFTLWPDTKNFQKNSPCNKQTCTWFRWSGNPTYLIIDTSPEWDIRHFLVNRDEFTSALSNMEKTGYIKRDKVFATTIIFKVLRKPTADPL